jgi:gliding motility-associated-like protein
MIQPMAYQGTISRCLIYLLLAMCCAFPAHTQYNAPQNKVWIFGVSAGLNFNNGSPVTITSNINATNTTGTLEANASVCDTNGLLLFYTDGSLVWNSLGNLMPNGTNLTGLGVTTTNSTGQGALIIPMPDSANKYYVFSLTAVDQPAALRGRLYYSVVNMDLNGGLGDIETGRKGITVDSGLTEKMIGVVGDRCNVWVITCVRSQSVYKAYEITAAGLNPVPVVSNVGTPKNLSFGYLAVSPNRKYIAASEQALFGGNNGLELSRFDAATGVISNAVQLEPTTGYYGISFSPDNSKLYGNSFQSVYQFDITAADPASTKTLICDNGRSSALQLGPDSRIYFHHSGTTNNKVSFIRFPNLAGTACQPLLDTITLQPGTTFSFGLHNTVPVFTRDTLSYKDTIEAGCFATAYNIKAADTTGWDYSWSTGSTAASITATSSGMYWVTYHTPPCIFHADTFNLTFPDGFLPQIDIRNSCKDDNNGGAWAYTYSGDTVTYHYAWINSAGDTLSVTDTMNHVPSGNYVLHVSTIHCDTTLAFYLSEEEHVVSFTSDTLICLGTTLQFINTSDNHFTQYQWFFGDGNSSSVISPNHLYTQPGNFTATLIGKGTVCLDTVQKNITVDAPVENLSFLTDKDSICTGQTIFFYPQTDSTTTKLYWLLGDGNSLTTSNEAIQHAYDKAGIMPLALQASFRVCSALDFNDTIYVYSLPLVDLGPDSVLCLGGKAVTLTNHHAAQIGYKYLWNNGETTESITVKHNGIYTLTVTNDRGCMAAESVTVNKDCFIDIPNAFTPNSDGSNDYFFPRQLLSEKLTKFNMQILNRWGQLVFETTAVNGRGWDGKFNGKDQPGGVYVYLIQVTLDNTRTEHYNGNVTLMR